MAIKKLQNNFTTPDQSKRLLELGVPADSADLYHDLSLNRRGMLSINGVYSLDVPYNHLFSDGTHRFLPCWSVGRLLEIMALCYQFDFPNNSSVQIYVTDIKKGTTVNVLISDIERFINKIDFSRLEE